MGILGDKVLECREFVTFFVHFMTTSSENVTCVITSCIISICSGKCLHIARVSIRTFAPLNPSFLKLLKDGYGDQKYQVPQMDNLRTQKLQSRTIRATVFTQNPRNWYLKPRHFT